MAAATARVQHQHRAEAASMASSSSSSAGEESRRLRRSPPVEMRRERERRRAREQPRCGEVAGGTAAECAAVCCCFPFAVVELVVLATVRVPAALCLRAVRGRSCCRRRRRRRKEMVGELLPLDASPRSLKAAAAAKAKKLEHAAAAEYPATPTAEHLGEVEKEVWASFYGAGFWRSPSQREDRR